MLRAHCPHHGRDVLLPASRIDGIDHTERAFLVRWHCWCGSTGTTELPRRRRSAV